MMLIVLKKIAILVLLSIIQIGLLIIIHDGVLQYLYKIDVHDLSWGISLRYFLYSYSIIVLFHNVVFVLFIRKRLMIYIAAILCLIILLNFIQINIYPLRSIFLISCMLFSFIIPVEVYFNYIKKSENKKRI